MVVRARFSACAGYLPSNILTNNDLSNLVNTSDEWILSRTGIKKRHIADKHENVSHMSAIAVQRLLDKTGIAPHEVDLLIVATTTPDAVFPSTACIVQNELKLENAACFDMQAACTGFIYATVTAAKFIESGHHKTAIVVGSDKLSSVVNWSDRSTCILFGDGAGAALIRATNLDSNTPNSAHIIDSALFSDGSLAHILRVAGNADDESGKKYITMNGTEVFRHATIKMTTMINEILFRNNYTIDDVDVVIPHQANARIISAVAERLGIELKKIVMTVSEHANTSAASIPLAFCDGMEKNMIKSGDLVILESVGAGLTWGIILLRF